MAEQVEPQGGELSVDRRVDANTHLLLAEALTCLGETRNDSDAAVYAGVALQTASMPDRAVSVYVLDQDLVSLRLSDEFAGTISDEEREQRESDYRAEVILRLACDVTVGFWASPDLTPEQAAHILVAARDVAVKITGDVSQVDADLAELIDWMWASNLRYRQRLERTKGVEQFSVSPEHTARIADALGIALTPESEVLAERDKRAAVMAERAAAQKTARQV